MRSVHTLASVHAHWGATSLPCLARGTPGRFNCIVVSFTPSLSCPPWLHGHYPLPRYYGDSDSCSARSGTEQVSLVHTLELLDIPSPTTPCAPVCRHCFGSGRLGQRFALGAIVSSSDFAHHMQAHQSHQAESSLCRRVQGTRLFYGLSFHFQLLSTRHCWLAVTFGYWREAPPKRDLHPPVQVRSQAHTWPHLTVFVSNVRFATRRSFR